MNEFIAHPQLTEPRSPTSSEHGEMQEGAEPRVNASAGEQLNAQYGACPPQSAHNPRHLVEASPTPNTGPMETGIVGANDPDGHRTMEGRR